MGGGLNKNILEINHCRKGGKAAVYQAVPASNPVGDFFIHTIDNCAPELTFPLKYHWGISVVIHLKVPSGNPPEYVTVDAPAIIVLNLSFPSETGLDNPFLLGQDMGEPDVKP